MANKDFKRSGKKTMERSSGKSGQHAQTDGEFRKTKKKMVGKKPTKNSRTMLEKKKYSIREEVFF